jgi:cbb3-type cytochrome oxidase subunit 3
MMWFAFAWLATCIVVFSVAALAPLFRMTEEDEADEADALIAMRKKGGGA